MWTALSWYRICLTLKNLCRGNMAMTNLCEAPYVTSMCVALHEVTWHGAWLYGVYRTCCNSSSFTWHQPCNNQNSAISTPLWWIFRKSDIHSFKIAFDKSTVSLLQSSEQCYIKAISKNNINHSALFSLTWQAQHCGEGDWKGVKWVSLSDVVSRNPLL